MNYQGIIIKIKVSWFST